METPTLWSAIKINWARFEWYRHCVEDSYIDPSMAWLIHRMYSAKWECRNWKLLSPDNQPVKNVVDAVRLWNHDREKRQRLSSPIREGEALVKAIAITEGGTEAAGAGGVLQGT